MIQNLTLLNLKLSKYPTHSPFFSKSRTQFFFHKNQFQYFLVPIILSRNHENPTLSIFQNSKFSFFLTSAIILEKDNPKMIENSNFSNNRQEFQQPIIFKNCEFSSFSNQNEIKGVVITSNFSLSFINCLFDQIFGYEGGGFFTSQKASLKFCSFSRIDVIKSGGFLIENQAVQNENPVISSISTCSFHKIKADLFPAFYINSLHNLSLSFSNFSKLEAKNCVGVFETVCYWPTIQSCVFNDCKAFVHNGGLVFRNLYNLHLSKTIFFKMAHNSDINLAGSAIFIFDCKNEAKILHCGFYFCDHKNSHTISIQNGGPIMIYDCSFSDSIEQELFGNIMFVKTDFSMSNSSEFLKFKDNQVEFENFVLSKTGFDSQKIGYNKDRKNYETNELKNMHSNLFKSVKPSKTNNKKKTIIIDIPIIVVSSLGALVISLIIDRISLRVSHKSIRIEQ